LRRPQLFIIVGCSFLCGCGAKEYTVVHPSDEAGMRRASDVVMDGQLTLVNYYSGFQWAVKAVGPDRVEYTVRIENLVKGTSPEASELSLKLSLEPEREMKLFNPDASGPRPLPLAVRVGFDRGLFGGLSDIWIMRRDK
jgi:hypothetical protein